MKWFKPLIKPHLTSLYSFKITLQRGKMGLGFADKRFAARGE